MRRAVTVAFVLAGIEVIGCSTVLGLTPGSPYDGDPGTEAGAGDVTSGCAAGTKSCGGRCVGVDDPAFGCGPTTCGACVGANVASFTCKSGACSISSCGAGVGDCDGDPKNGCESDTTSGAHCGSCGNVCSGATPICQDTTCIGAASCTGTVCGTSCVDTTKALHHCGTCAKDCTSPQPQNTAADCAASKCVYACAAGAEDCNGDLSSASTNGCECTTGCSALACCPATGCSGPPDAGGDGGPPDSGPPPDSAPPPDSGCGTIGCTPAGAGCTLSATCCCPMICGLAGILPFSSAASPTPEFFDAAVGGVCCIPAGTTTFGVPCPASSNPCCAGAICVDGANGGRCQ